MWSYTILVAAATKSFTPQSISAQLTTKPLTVFIIVLIPIMPNLLLQDELPLVAQRSFATTTGDERHRLRTIKSLKNKGSNSAAVYRLHSNDKHYISPLQ